MVMLKTVEIRFVHWSWSEICLEGWV